MLLDIHSRYTGSFSTSEEGQAELLYGLATDSEIMPKFEMLAYGRRGMVFHKLCDESSAKTSSRIFRQFIRASIIISIR